MAMATGERSFGPLEKLALIELAALSIAAFLHWLQLSDLNAYRNSPLIVIEILGLLGAFLFVPVFLVRATYLLGCRRFRKGLVNAILCAVAFAVVMWAMWLDSPTLIYMT